MLKRELSLFGAFGWHGGRHQGHPLAVVLLDAFCAAIMAVAEQTSRAQLPGAYIGDSRSQRLAIMMGHLMNGHVGNQVRLRRDRRRYAFGLIIFGVGLHDLHGIALPSMRIVA